MKRLNDIDFAEELNIYFEICAIEEVITVLLNESSNKLELHLYGGIFGVYVNSIGSSSFQKVRLNDGDNYPETIASE
jgi:hypothetical protein